MQAARPSCAELEEYLAQLRRKKVRAAEASSPPAEKRAGGGGMRLLQLWRVSSRALSRLQHDVEWRFSCTLNL